MIIRKIDDIFVIKISREEVNKIDIFNNDEIKIFFQDLLIKIKKKYKLSGILEMEVYVNEYYGMIIELKSVFNYFEEIDLRIHFHLNCTFLYEINDNDLISSTDVYFYKDKYYKIYKSITDSSIIYKTDIILGKGVKIL